MGVVSFYECASNGLFCPGPSRSWVETVRSMCCLHMHRFSLITTYTFINLFNVDPLVLSWAGCYCAFPLTFWRAFPQLQLLSSGFFFLNVEDTVSNNSNRMWTCWRNFLSTIWWIKLKGQLVSTGLSNSSTLQGHSCVASSQFGTIWSAQPAPSIWPILIFFFGGGADIYCLCLLFKDPRRPKGKHPNCNSFLLIFCKGTWQTPILEGYSVYKQWKASPPWHDFQNIRCVTTT